MRLFPRRCPYLGPYKRSRRSWRAWHTRLLEFNQLHGDDVIRRCSIVMDVCAGGLLITAWMARNDDDMANAILAALFAIYASFNARHLRMIARGE